MTDDRTREIQQSLLDAGIGKRFHDARLEDYGVPGANLKRWFTANANAIRDGGKSGIFHGVGLTDIIHTMARGLHVNRVGARVMPLVKLGMLLKQPDKIEELQDEVGALFIMNAADSRKGAPLYDSRMAEVEWLIRQRFDERKSTFLHFSVDDSSRKLHTDNSYWSDEMLYFFNKHFDIIRGSELSKAPDA